MKKSVGFILMLFFMIGLNFVSASVENVTDINSEISKLTSYAQDYEIGNINYAQLLVSTSSVRGRMNEVMGATSMEKGGMLKEEQLKSVLGEPTEKTKWVWVENEEREEKMQNEVPVWRKIVFDGNKIQLWLSAWPNLLKKDNENMLFYRLNVDVQFKKPGEQLDISERISEIKSLAENYNKNPSTENAELLAQKSVSAERAFESYFRQNQAKCEDIMKSIFGSENKRESQKMLVQEIELYEGDNFVVIARLEMCDECEWHWINLDIRLDGRGPGFKPPKTNPEIVSPEQFRGLDDSGFRKTITDILQEIKNNLQEGNYNRVIEIQGRIHAINEAWNQKSNNVWQEVEKVFEEKRKSMTQKEQEEFNKNYGWIREEQDKRKQVQEIVDRNYQGRKEFYLNLFSGYNKKEFYFTQEEYEKRLVEEFKEFGKEICDNNLDDNKNEKIDCSDDQCLGKICGKQNVKKIVTEGNETKEIEVMQDLYCISGVCQAKEEIVVIKEAVCGNHVCEGNETEGCIEDCSICKKYEAVNCSGKVIFKGKNENNCPLEPICLNETYFCQKNEDCLQPLCGKAECVDGTCKTTTLEECKEVECVAGQEKVKNCDDGNKLVIEKCMDGLWRETGEECKVTENVSIGNCNEYCSTKSYIMCEGHLKVSGNYPNCECEMICETKTKNECSIKEDCGSENDVCSNGECVILPEAIQQPAEQFTEQEQPEQQPQPQEQIQPGEEEQSSQEQEQQTSQQEQSEQQTPEQSTTETETITGQIIAGIKKITGRFTGFVLSLTSKGVEETPTGQEQPQEQLEQPQSSQEQPEQQPSEQTQFDQEQRPQQDQEIEENRERRERENAEREEGQRENCKQGCENPCRDMLIAPCVEQCVRESECKDDECVNNKINECEGKCKQEKNFDSCVQDCSEKCIKGEEFRIDQMEREEPKMEKGVFKVGGACRTSQQKTEGFVFFDGWGEPFEKLRMYKQKYYTGGNADWCKEDLENLIAQRKEFEKSFNEEFVKWFFEKYLANSAEEWEQHVSGIFELYWKDVDNSRQIAERLNCLEKAELLEHNLININYETEFGKLEFWEEIKTIKLPGSEKEASIISPYMKIWIFPPKEFIIFEMKQLMKNHEFPGPSEDKIERQNEEGLTAEEKENIKQDKKFMEKIKKVSDKYGGNLNLVIRFVDNGNVVFNLYAQVNENDIISIKPMLPEEVPKEDARIEIEFQKLYDIIYIQEKNVMGERIESPPWDRKAQPIQKVKDAVNGVKMYLKMRDMLGSAKIYPEASEDDVNFLMKPMFGMMMGLEKPSEMQQGEAKEENLGEEKNVWEEKEKITGEIIINWSNNYY